MKALIVGSGAQGSVIATEIVKSPKVSEVRLSDIDLKKAERLAERLKSEKVRTYRVDANEIDDVIKAARGVDVIVNATTWRPQFNLNIMEAALKLGVHYQDLASYPPQQLALSDKWKKAGLTALIDTGVSPGVTNVLAAHAADRLDRVDAIRIKLASKVVKEPKEYVPTWSPETAWTDMAAKPIVYEDGNYKEVPPFSGEEVYNFPDPVGPVTVYWHSHEEPETLPRFIGKGVRYVDFKMGGRDFPVAKAIVEFGLLNDKPISAKGIKVAPRDIFFALLPPTLPPEEMEKKREAGVLGESLWCMLVEVEGEKAGEKLTYTLYRIARQAPGVPSIPITGISASIFTMFLGERKIKTTGVIPTEGLEPKVRQAFITELAKYGLFFTERVERRLV